MGNPHVSIFPLVPSISLKKNPPVSCLGGWETFCVAVQQAHLNVTPPVFILCLVTVSILALESSLSSQISSQSVHTISYQGGTGRRADLSLMPHPASSWCPSVLLPSQCSVGWIGLLGSISFGRWVCWGHLSSASSVTASLSPFHLSTLLWSYTCRLISFYFLLLSHWKWIPNWTYSV